MKLRYIQASKVKAYMKEQGLRTSGKFLDCLDREVQEMLCRYQAAAKMDRCKTILPVHLEIPGLVTKINRAVQH